MIRTKTFCWMPSRTCARNSKNSLQRSIESGFSTTRHVLKRPECRKERARAPFPFAEISRTDSMRVWIRQDTSRVTLHLGCVFENLPVEMECSSIDQSGQREYRFLYPDWLIDLSRCTFYTQECRKRKTERYIHICFSLCSFFFYGKGKKNTQYTIGQNDGSSEEIVRCTGKEFCQTKYPSCKTFLSCRTQTAIRRYSLWQYAWFKKQRITSNLCEQESTSIVSHTSFVISLLRYSLSRYNYFVLLSTLYFEIHVFLQNYGKVPKFVVVDTKADVSVETEVIKQRDFNGDKTSREKISSCRYIDREERRILLDVGV